MVYKILFTSSARKGLKSVPKKDQRRILGVIEKLATNPRPEGVKVLQGVEGLLRLRVGNYRIVYQVKDEVLEVLIIRIGDRKDVYRKL